MRSLRPGLAREGRVPANALRGAASSAPASPRAGSTPELRRSIDDVEAVLNERLARRERVIVDGTQGFGLSLNFGDWPTSLAETRGQRRSLQKRGYRSPHR